MNEYHEFASEASVKKLYRAITLDVPDNTDDFSGCADAWIVNFWLRVLKAYSRKVNRSFFISGKVQSEFTAFDFLPEPLTLVLQKSAAYLPEE